MAIFKESSPCEQLKRISVVLNTFPIYRRNTHYCTVYIQYTLYHAYIYAIYIVVSTQVDKNAR